MENLRKFYIGGEWVDPNSSATIPALNWDLTEWSFR